MKVQSEIYSRERVLQLHWQGPFLWPGYEDNSDITGLEHSSHYESTGIYLWTVKHLHKYLIYNTGQTYRPFYQDFVNIPGHIRKVFSPSSIWKK